MTPLRLLRTILVALVSFGLLVIGTAAPAEAHPRHHADEARLLADLWKVSFRTQYDLASVPKSPDLNVDPLGNLYLCARAGNAIAPFTNAALQMRCRARPGQPLLLVGTSSEWSTAETLPSQPTILDQVNADLDHHAEGYPQVLLDGRPLHLDRVVTRLTPVDRIADPNLVGVVPPSRRTEFIAGAWMTVVPAAPGVHTVEFRPVPGISATAVIDARCR